VYFSGRGGGVGIFGTGNSGVAGGAINGSVNIGDGVAYGWADGQMHNGPFGSAGGAVRIIWGPGRSFPSNAADV
jgi:hypothetical protein